MNHQKKNSGKSGLQTPANRRVVNQQVPQTPSVRNAGSAEDFENNPTQDPRLHAYYKHENQARFNRSALQRPHEEQRHESMLQRNVWGPIAHYEMNDMTQLESDETAEDEAQTLNRLREERSRMLDDE